MENCILKFKIKMKIMDIFLFTGMGFIRRILTRKMFVEI